MINDIMSFQNAVGIMLMDKTQCLPPFQSFAPIPRHRHAQIADKGRVYDTQTPFNALVWSMMPEVMPLVTHALPVLFSFECVLHMGAGKAAHISIITTKHDQC